MSIADIWPLGLLFLFPGKKSDLPSVDDDDDDDPNIPRPTPRPRPRPRPDAPDPGDPTEPTGPAIDWPKFVDDNSNANYPTDGKLYQVKAGDQFLGNSAAGGIAHRAIAQRAFIHLTANGWDNPAALEEASKLATEHRLKYFYQIQADAWNDNLYGTYGYGRNAMPSPSTGRAIRLLPMNPPNLGLIRQGKQPGRSVLLQKPSHAKQGTGKKAPGAPGGSLEFLWLPAIDPARLVSGDLVILDKRPEVLDQLGIRYFTKGPERALDVPPDAGGWG